jgi:transcriptional regulator with XRE-family HTH domain
MLPEIMKKLRKKRNWSQQDLAVKAGLSVAAITKIEQGIAKNPRMETIKQIADAFEVPLDELVGRKLG